MLPLLVVLPRACQRDDLRTCVALQEWNLRFASDDPVSSNIVHAQKTRRFGEPDQPRNV